MGSLNKTLSFISLYGMERLFIEKQLLHVAVKGAIFHNRHYSKNGRFNVHCV